MTEVSQVLESRRARIGRWAGAAVVVCALHAGGLLALMHWQEEDTADDAAGAMTVELAPLPAAARVDSPDVAHGPEQQQAKLTPQASKQAAEEVKDIPPVDPSPAPDPAVTLPKPRPVEKEQPKQEEAREAVAEKQVQQQDEEVKLTTAPPRVEAEAARRLASSPGQSASLARVQARWHNSLLGKLNRYKRYPDAASRRRIKGVAVVRFRVDRSGNVISSEITKSSGSPVLDEEAVALLKRVSPLPAPPNQLDESLLDMDYPIGFGMEPHR